MAKGNQNGTEQFLISVPLPEETDSYTVISHQEIIEKVENELNNANLEIINTDYTYSYNGEVALAKVYIKSVVDVDMGMLFTWQNSYNKKVKFSCAIGAYIHENNASLIGTEGLSWIRKHTGDANDEAYQVIESLIDMADVHFTKVIAEKERMKAMELNTEAYGRVMGALYFEHSLVTPNQASIVKKEREKPLHTYSDKDTLWGLYKLLMYGIENADIIKWQQSQQKLHHLIMAEYALSQEEIDNPSEIINSDEAYENLVSSVNEHSDNISITRTVIKDADISQEMTDYHNHPEAPMPLAPNELRETGPPTQEEMKEVTPEIHIESDIEYQERVVAIEEGLDHKGEDEIESTDVISREDCCIEGTHMASVDDDGLCNNCGEQEACATTELEDVQEEFEQAVEQEVNEEVEMIQEEIDFIALANKYTAEELVEPVPIIAPTINLPKEDDHQDALDKSAEKGSEEFMLPEDKEESFLDVSEHKGLTVPKGLIEDAAVVEKRMILLYGSIKPYTIEKSGNQINVVLEKTYESFYVST